MVLLTPLYRSHSADYSWILRVACLLLWVINMLLMSDSSSARLLISWFELVHPIHCSADRIFRWADEQLLGHSWRNMIVTPRSHAYHRNDVLIRFLVHESLCVCWSWYHIHSTQNEIPLSNMTLASQTSYRRLFWLCDVWRKVSGLCLPWSLQSCPSVLTDVFTLICSLIVFQLSNHHPFSCERT